MIKKLKIIMWVSLFAFYSNASIAEKIIPRFDAHIHYSHDAWDVISPKDAIETLEKAGIKHAFVSSSSDEATQKLFNVDNNLIIPVLRPYRKRGELNSWYNDITVLDMLREKLAKYEYAGIGEFHVAGKYADTVVVKGLVDLAMKHKIFMHAHSDADAINRLFNHAPNARILWAHGGFEELNFIKDMLKKYDNLWVDLAYRFDYSDGYALDDEWLNAFQEYPNRFMLGTDTYTPENWSYVVEQSETDQLWLNNIPKSLAEKISWKNAYELARWSAYKINK